MKNKSILLAACLVASLGVVSCSSKNPASIYISSENDVHSLEVGQTLQLKAEVSPKGASQDVIWESGNVDIATINETGLVTTLNEGNVIISATSKVDNSIKGEYALIVTKSSATVKPTNITLVASKTTIDINESLKLVVRVTPENASDEVTFSTSDSSTVSCSATGDIKGLKAGKATITATSKVDTTIKGSIEIIVNSTQSVDGGNYDDLPFATHEEYINAEEDSTIKVKGVAKYVNVFTEKEVEKVSYYLFNGSEGYYVYGQTVNPTDIKEGKVYEIGGKKKVYNGTHEIVNCDYYKELKETITSTAMDITSMNFADSATMLPYQSNLVTLTDVSIVTIPTKVTKAYSVKVESEGKQIDLRVDPKNMSAETFSEIGELITSLSAGQSISVTGAMSAFGYGKPANQISICDNSFKISELTDAQKVAAAKDVLSVKCSLTKEETSLSLPTSSSAFENVSISWASSNESVISTTGVVTHQTNDVEVTLTATLSLNGNNETKTFVIDVLGDDPINLVHTLNFEDASANGQYGCSETKGGYADGNVTLGAPEQKIWKLASTLIEYDTAEIISGRFSGRIKKSGYLANVDSISCNYVQATVRNYNDGTLNGTWSISYSNDGTNYTKLDKTYFVGTEVTTIRAKLPSEASYIKIILDDAQGKAVFNIDDVKLYR